MIRRARLALVVPGLRIVVAFGAIAAAVFGVPAAAGATWLVGDNLIQNYPLRVLVGTDLLHGHLPLWDPYLWSGSPLLAGFNAGAAYPTTWLFAVLPGTFAWVLNQVTVEVVAGAGMVVLLRVLGRSWLAAGLGAGAFTFGGFMAAQSVHIDLVQAAAWLPWAFVALDRFAHRPAGQPLSPWVALLGAALGLMALTGAVEPDLDGGVVLLLYAAWLAWRTPGRRRLAVVAGTVSGAVVGVLVGAAQLLPGAAYQSQSQRAMHSFLYFASGSMNKSLTVLGLDPLILGGGHSFPLGYVGTFNLPEISSYIGILPVMGLVGLLARRHRRAPEADRWWIWYAILVVGLILTWGGFTPLAHVAYDLPLFNRQRLLSRNILEVDLALAVIFAAWVDRMFATASATGDPPPSSSPPSSPSAQRPRWVPRRWPAAWSSDVVLPLIPPAAVVALQIVLLAGGTWFPHFVHVPGQVTRARLAPLVAYLTIPSAVCVGASGIVVGRARLGRRLPQVIVAVLAIDLVVFNVSIQSLPDPQAATSSTAASANRLAAEVAADGQGPAGEQHRLAMFDPDRFYATQINRLGEPDLTILRSLDSVQGYGAVVDAHYDTVTGTHLQLNLTPAALSAGTFAPLDLGVLVSVPEYFLHLVHRPPGFTGSLADGATPLPPVAPDAAAQPDQAAPAPTPAGDYLFAPAPSPASTLSGGQKRTQYLGTVLSVTAVTLPVVSAPAGAALRIGVLSADGRTTTWLGAPQPLAGRSSVTARGTPRPASGIVLQAVALAGSGTSGTPLATGSAAAAPEVVVGDAVVRTEGQGTYRVDGSLRDTVTQPRWRFVGMIGDFCVFVQPSARGRAWVSGDAGSAHVVSDSPWGDETISVDTHHAARLVRSVQYAAGWEATVTPTGSTGSRRAAARPVSVRQDGLIQSVAVPAGTSLVRFAYHPARAYDGIALSVSGVLVAVVLGSWPALAARRRRHRSSRTAAAP